MLLMFSPVRSVLAGQSEHCNMDEMKSSMSEMKTAPSYDNDKHASHDMSAKTSKNSKHLTQHPVSHHNVADQAAAHQCCCCDDADACSGNCEMGMSVSLVLQESFYSPVFKDASRSGVFSSTVLIRELTPPSRPPAFLHS